jgi:hypothetical protein
MERKPATNRNAFSQPLPPFYRLGPFQILGSSQILPDHSDDTRAHVAGDGFVLMMIATITVAAAVILALD